MPLDSQLFKALTDVHENCLPALPPYEEGATGAMPGYREAKVVKTT